MIIISSTGGGGSSYVVSAFSKRNWKCCVRPDGGKQKANRSVHSVWADRTKPFFAKPDNYKSLNDKQLCSLTLEKLKKHKKLMLMCMSWGGMGLLNEMNNIIYLIRDPIFAFNSYSGGGWRSEGGKRRIKYVGASGPNDRKWIDAFFGDFSYWINGAKNALKAKKKGTGYIVRYNKLAEDWKSLPMDLPPIYKGFECKDDISKVKGYLNNDTINYINSLSGDLWNEINKL